MAIVLDLVPQGSIDSYSKLVVELRDLQDNTAYDVGAIARAVRKAEAFFVRRLRLADMEVSSILPVLASTATLPSDCRELRAVIWRGAGREYPLTQTSLAGLSSAYGGQSGAEPLGYAREGNSLRFGPVTTGTARIVYFADLVPLTDEQPVNWLLQTAPDLYIAGAQYYLCRRERDVQGAGMALNEMDAIIDAINQEAAKKAGGNLIPHGITQVNSARA